MRILSIIATTLLLASSAYAQVSISTLETTALPMHSRTCGLILLSDGRALLRAQNGQEKEAMAELTHAFALLQDGRPLEDKTLARAMSQEFMKPGVPLDLRASAVSHCESWIAFRAAKPDFNKSEQDEWGWVQQAMFTAQTEK